MHPCQSFCTDSVVEVLFCPPHLQVYLCHYTVYVNVLYVKYEMHFSVLLGGGITKSVHLKFNQEYFDCTLNISAHLPFHII